MRHSTGSKQLVIRSKILSPPRGTQKEFTSTKLATTRVSKGKSSKKSIPGIGKPLPSTMKKTQVPPKENKCSYRQRAGTAINEYTHCSSFMITTSIWATCTASHCHPPNWSTHCLQLIQIQIVF